MLLFVLCLKFLLDEIRKPIKGEQALEKSGGAPQPPDRAGHVDGVLSQPVLHEIKHLCSVQYHAKVEQQRLNVPAETSKTGTEKALDNLASGKPPSLAVAEEKGDNDNEFNCIEACRRGEFFDSDVRSTKSLQTFLIHLHDTFASLGVRFERRIKCDVVNMLATSERHAVEINPSHLPSRSRPRRQILIMLEVAHNLEYWSVWLAH